MRTQTKKENNIWLYIIGIFSVILIIVLWFLTYFYLKDLEPNDRGTLGDMFGTINALFSGLAFAGIIFTILLQRRELKYQREELQATRREFTIQNKTLKSQKFENTFFGLMDLHNRIVNDIDYKVGDDIGRPIEIIKGRDVFCIASSELRSNLNNNLNNISLERSYLKMYGLHNTDFGHYFRNLYRIFKIIHQTEFVSMSEIVDFNYDDEELDIDELYYELNFKEKYKYSSIMRAQLSDYELFILFYNCLTKLSKKFKPLVEEYSLLKTLPKHFIKDVEHLKFYKSKAFESNH
tara:strand:- start:21901 stop:22779 length:879 start_codon:yes stop_codon:yes gene_type:complete